MAIDKKSLKKMFPHLYEELEAGEVKVPINAMRKNAVEAEEEVAGEECGCEEEEFTPCTEAPDKLRHFNPSAVDFIRRCDTETQAKEIIDYLQKKGELTKESADQMRCQLKQKGVRSFGPKKEENYYFKEGGIY
ncbi:MAG TPA: DUF2095 family protein [Candidatus Binatia bacterium]|nr:DUF2095 family protein [Candidatus Binatia bacterium]